MPHPPKPPRRIHQLRDDPAARSQAAIVAEIITTLGMTQERFAQVVGVTVSTINRWTNGHARPQALAWREMRRIMQERGKGWPREGVAGVPLGMPPLRMPLRTGK